MNVVDLNFVTDGTLERIAAQHKRWEEIRRDCFKHNLRKSFDYAEAALDHAGNLIRGGHSVAAELDEAETLLKAFLVQVMALRHAGSE